MSVKRGMTVPVFPHQFARKRSLIPIGGKKFCSCEPKWPPWRQSLTGDTGDATLPRFGRCFCFWLVEANFRHGMTNQKHYPDLVVMEFLRSSQTTFCRKPVVASRNVGCFLGYSFGKIWCMGLLEIRSVLVPFLQLNNYSHLVYCLFKLRVNSQTSLVLCYSMCGFRKQTETLKHLMRHVIGSRKYTTRSLS